MSTNITFNGVTYAIPAEGDSGWGTVLSNLFIAIGSGALQKTGGSFTLTAETDFGATYGLKLAYLKSQSANPSASGILRLGNAESLAWRNAANNADLPLTVNASNALQFNGNTILDSAGSGLTGLIVNSMVSASAAIALSKLAALGLGKALQSNATTGVIEVSSVTNAELGYLSGVTSALQTQINAKEPTLTAGTSSQYYRGDKTWQTLDKTSVGLANVDNTSDATKNSATANLSNKTFTNKTTFNAEIVGASADISTAGSAVTIAAPGVLVNNLTGALTSLSGITAVTGVQPLILVNKTGSDLTVKNEDATATAANRLITGTANDLTFKSLASLWLIYDLTAARWRVVGGSGGSNIVVTSSLSLAASGTITPDPTSTVQTVLVQGASAPITLSTTPFTSTAPQNGTNITLIGNSDANTVTIPSNDAAKGVLGYSVTLGKGQTVTYEYNSTLDRYVILGVSN